VKVPATVTVRVGVQPRRSQLCSGTTVGANVAEVRSLARVKSPAATGPQPLSSLMGVNRSPTSAYVKMSTQAWGPVALVKTSRRVAVQTVRAPCSVQLWAEANAPAKASRVGAAARA
jgi:hypothetical protein